MARVAVFGSLNVDRTKRVSYDRVEELREEYDWFPDEDETRSVPEGSISELPAPDAVSTGGKGANQAIAAAHAGVETTMFGRVGPDAEDAGVFDALESAGVDTAGVETVETPTGSAYIFLTPDGENRIAIEAGANGEVDPAFAESCAAEIRDADVLLLQNEIPVEAAERLLDSLADDLPEVVLDPAPAPGAERLVRPPVKYLTPNEREREQLEEAGALADFDGTLIETRGADAVVVEGAASFSVRPPEVDSRDTTGAGDTFAGYLAADLARGRSLQEAVERATVAASLSTREQGAQTAPDEAELEAFFEFLQASD